jgi:hypothetical protein
MIRDLDTDDILALGAIVLFTAVLLLYSAVIAGVLQ